MNEHTTPKHFVIPILKILESYGGSANTDDIQKELLQEMRGQLTKSDFNSVPISKSSVEPRWWNNARHAAEQMRKDKKGLLEKSEQSGVWKRTEQGRKLLIQNSKSMNLLAIPMLAHEDAASLINEEYNPDDVDHRVLVERQIRARRGQQKFREKLRSRFSNCCVITGCRIVDVLEAAHINPYRGDNDNNPGNGLLLRADIHTLFDLNLVGIEPTSLKIRLHPSIDKEYRILIEERLQCTERTRPSKTALEIRYKQFLQRNS